MQVCRACLAAFTGVLFLSLFKLSECLQKVVRPNNDSFVTVSTNLGICSLCPVADQPTNCLSSLSLLPDTEVTLNFNCSAQDYMVNIARNIECTSRSCIPSTVEAQDSFFIEFPRTFTWDLQVPEKTVVGLDILGEGLKEVQLLQICADGLNYSVARLRSNGQVQIQTYCRGGSVTHFDLFNQVTVSLQVDANSPAALSFTVSVKPLKDRTMSVTSDPETTAVVLTAAPEGPDCNVCINEGSSPTCSHSGALALSKPTNTLKFSCPQPQDVFTVVINKKLECTQNTCNPVAGVVQADFFTEFHRVLVWDVTIPSRTVLTLNLLDGGVKEMAVSESCQDGYQYIVRTISSEGVAKSLSYCENGPLSHLDLYGNNTLTVNIPKERDLGFTAFTANVIARGRMSFVAPDPDTIVTISRRSKEPTCSVCTGQGSQQTCNPKTLTLRDVQNATVDFTCAQPHDYFTVEINRKLDCTDTACSHNIFQGESRLLHEFNRTFSWDVKAPPTRIFRVDFPAPGVRQIANGETCLDDHTYTLVAYLRYGPATAGTYCKGGPIRGVQVRYKGRLQLVVPGDRKLQPLDFPLNIGPVTSTVVIVTVELPRGTSDTDLFSANYPKDFPNNEQMRWDFTVPGMHNYTTSILNYTAPQCLNKEVAVLYQRGGETAASLLPTDPQPEQMQGNFSMALSNCDTNTTLPGLALKFRVSVMRSGHPVLCTVDLTNKDDTSLHIEKVGTDPYCEISINSVVKEKINVPSGKKASLSFLDCPNEDVRLTASKVIGCQTLSSCSVKETPLTVPELESCLPVPLHSFTWHLNVPDPGAADLASPTGSLRQSLPSQECKGSMSVHVAEKHGGAPIGLFCPTGFIQKVQVHTNVSVTATGEDISRTRGPFLNVSFTNKISESVIYTVNPTPSSPALLATPNWPHGMTSYSTVSWVVRVPSHYKAELHFSNVSQPTCSEGHTSIDVRTFGSKEAMLRLKEDDTLVEHLVVPESFYLNMSNCVPETGSFGAVARIVLHKTTNLLVIILGILGALLVLFIILAVVCVVKKKKKTVKMTKGSSIYGKGNIFQQSVRSLPESNSPIYDSIDDTVVYGHLLPPTSIYTEVVTQDHFKGIPVDTYRTFIKPVDEEPPVVKEPEREAEKDAYRPFLDPSESFHPSRPRTPIDRQDSLDFHDRRMVDNELYTFKSTGDINTIRLFSPADTMSEESV